MVGIVLGGILVGAILGFAYQYLTLYASLGAESPAGPLAGMVLQQGITYALLSAGAAAVGAWNRLR